MLPRTGPFVTHDHGQGYADGGAGPVAPRPAADQGVGRFTRADEVRGGSTPGHALNDFELAYFELVLAGGPQVLLRLGGRSESGAKHPVDPRLAAITAHGAELLEPLPAPEELRPTVSSWRVAFSAPIRLALDPSTRFMLLSGGASPVALSRPVVRPFTTISADIRSGGSGPGPRQVLPDRERPGIDELTGLGDSKALERALSDQITRARRSGTELSLVLFDIDRFEAVNNRYGREVGDAVLRAAAHELCEQTAEDGLCFRPKSDELIAILPGCGESAACELAHAVRRAVVRGSTDLPAITVSCGVAGGHCSDTHSTLLAGAGMALRVAKRGRNRVAVASDPLRERRSLGEGPTALAHRSATEVAVAALAERHGPTADHSEDVVTLCGAIADVIGMEGSEREQLLAGARLHDIGKIAVPSELLNKPGPLTGGEWETVREHTPAGERILRVVPEMAEVATIVRHSHERYDGDGYPDGLIGDSIPLASRVILCADAFHAMRSDRSYRSARKAKSAMAELRAHAGSQFDPSVVQALEELRDDLARPSGTRVLGSAATFRSPRLLALLLTLMLGGGSALATFMPGRRGAGTAIASTPPASQREPSSAGRSCLGVVSADPHCDLLTASSRSSAPGQAPLAKPAPPGPSRPAGPVTAEMVTRPPVPHPRPDGPGGASKPPGLTLANQGAPKAPSPSAARDPGPASRPPTWEAITLSHAPRAPTGQVISPPTVPQLPQRPRVPPVPPPPPVPAVTAVGSNRPADPPPPAAIPRPAPTLPPARVARPATPKLP